ncbi:hypothetical protein PsYK624_166320 [Phanerochaete sordida]|uniref:Uncharacterized protein n=1 Tax=Phanerochaete sordida TaxID=48140 RepID=A0A9P3LM99_9APHY|nr:hypothetical protein PsYK624_166320 [Phanerochaete sordida]
MSATSAGSSQYLGAARHGRHAHRTMWTPARYSGTSVRIVLRSVDGTVPGKHSSMLRCRGDATREVRCTTWRYVPSSCERAALRLRTGLVSIHCRLSKYMPFSPPMQSDYQSVIVPRAGSVMGQRRSRLLPLR